MSKEEKRVLSIVGGLKAIQEGPYVLARYTINDNGTIHSNLSIRKKQGHWEYYLSNGINDFELVDHKLERE